MSYRVSPLVRYEGNPILAPETMPFPCYSVFNSGAIRFRNRFLLLLRVESFKRETECFTALSDDGIHFEVSPEPIDYPMREVESRWKGQRFDMRITCLEGRYYVCHAVWIEPYGCCAAIAETEDFVRFRPLPGISVPSNRNVALFPERIRGKYVRLERPQHIDGTGRVWVSESPDLVHWGNARPVPLPTVNWAFTKSGAGIVPIRTPSGWLEIYHTTSKTASSENYYLGAALLDLEDPSKVIAAPREFLLGPERDYECVGQVPNVVFTCGAIEDNGVLNVYYGGADTRMCLARAPVADLVEFCLSSAER